MAVKKYKPNTAGRRISSVDAFADITKWEPEKSLTVRVGRNGGRNNQGKITVRHQGGGARKLYRVVDFKQDKYGIPGKVKTIEYDPNRNARLALVAYADGKKCYMVAPEGLKVGQTVLSSATEKLEQQAGNRMPIKFVLPGTMISNVELWPGKGGQLARSAGNSVLVQGIENGRAQIKLPSSEVRTISEDCLATIGQVSNSEWRNIRWGKAGRMRNRGIRPTVRGKVMNPVDHPHGGGEGKHPIGMVAPKMSMVNWLSVQRHVILINKLISSLSLEERARGKMRNYESVRIYEFVYSQEFVVRM